MSALRDPDLADDPARVMEMPELAAILAEGPGPASALAFLAQVLNALPVAISIYDGSDDSYRVLYLNPAIESFAGPVSQPVQRSPMAEVYPQADLDRVRTLFAKTLAEGPQHLRDFVSHTGRHFDVDSYRVEGSGGRPYLLLVAQEITELMAANLAKAQFMNMAAHELRTPLSVIKGYLSMLREGTFGAPPSAWAPPLEIISTKTIELDQLVDSVLTAARLEGATVPARPALHNLRVLARRALERSHARASLIGARVEGDLEGEPILVEISEDHAFRIIDNLINNALTYSASPGWVQVSVYLREREGVVAVTDHGRGIPADHQARIFEQFVRVEDAEFGYPPGSGLGLYISRKLAEMYGGGLELEESELGRGSTFLLKLPLATVRTEPTGPPDLG